MNNYWQANHPEHGRFFWDNAACQQLEGYWTRSMLDPQHVPGPQTSGTAFFTYGLQWGINNGFLNAAEYQPVVEKAWEYLSTVALQPDGKIGYVQPIGSLRMGTSL